MDKASKNAGDSTTPIYKGISIEEASAISNQIAMKAFELRL